MPLPSRLTRRFAARLCRRFYLPTALSGKRCTLSCERMAGLSLTALMRWLSVARTSRPACSPVRIRFRHVSLRQPTCPMFLLRLLPSVASAPKTSGKNRDAEAKAKRAALGRCKNPNCKFAHVCPIPLLNGKPCGQKHTVAEHQRTKH